MEQKKPPLILIVDDEERMRRVITDYLRIKGYDTMEDGKEYNLRQQGEQKNRQSVVGAQTIAQPHDVAQRRTDKGIDEFQEERHPLFAEFVRAFAPFRMNFA